MPKNPDSENSRFHYQGFSSPNGTIVPDDVFDILAPQLSEGELRVLLYIIRRTFGFKKDSDNISLRQMVEGIVTKDGRVLDRGAGIAKSAVARAVKGLEEKGVIIAIRNSSPERGYEPTSYALRFRDDPLFSKRTRGSSPGGQGLVLQEDIQQTGIQTTDLQQTDINSNGFEGNSLHINRRGNLLSKKRGVDRKQDGNSVVYAQSPAAEVRPHLASPAPVSEVLAQTYGDRLRERLPDASGGPTDGLSTDSRPRGRVTASVAPRGRPPKATPWIEAEIERISSEFHDEGHTRSNIGQAARLWKASGRSEELFCQLIGEARAITKQQGNIQKRADGEAGSFGLRNKMPYFFEVLKDLLGMRDAAGNGPSALAP